MSASSPPNPNFGKAVLLLATLGLLLVVLMGLARVGSLSQASSPMPPKASDPVPQRGEAQENSVRSLIEKEGYEQPFGTKDSVIAKNLNIKGDVADVVGYHPELKRWVVAESKGNDPMKAFSQLENTAQHLVTKEPRSVGHLDLRLYLKQIHYEKLFQEPNRIGGWRLKDGFLGWIKGETGEWMFAEVEGARVAVIAIP